MALFKLNYLYMISAKGSLNSLDLLYLQNEIIGISLKAGEIILEHYQKNKAQITNKEDKSPVTDADIASNNYICSELKKLKTKFPVISEELDKPSQEKTLSFEAYWLVDPLDGTKSYISRTGEFAVNIALIQNNTPILGVIYLPTKNTLYYATKGHGAFKKEGKKNATPIKTRSFKSEDVKILMSRHNKAFEELLNLPYNITIEKSSASGKFGVLSEGLADYYLRNGPTYEWDTASGHAIILEAGGVMLSPDGSDFEYSKKNFLNGGFLVVADKQGPWKDFIKFTCPLNKN